MRFSHPRAQKQTQSGRRQNWKQTPATAPVERKALTAEHLRPQSPKDVNRPDAGHSQPSSGRGRPRQVEGAQKPQDPDGALKQVDVHIFLKQ